MKFLFCIKTLQFRNSYNFFVFLYFSTRVVFVHKDALLGQKTHLYFQCKIPVLFSRQCQCHDSFTQSIKATEANGPSLRVGATFCCCLRLPEKVGVVVCCYPWPPPRLWQSTAVALDHLQGCCCSLRPPLGLLQQPQSPLRVLY